VIVEDWHRVTDAESVAALAFLLERGCHHLQVLVTSRSQAGLPIGKMRVDDELIEIDATALRFEQTEARDLLTEVGHLRLGDADVAGLCTYTDGWAAGLQLASLSLRGQQDPAVIIEHITGRHHAISQLLQPTAILRSRPSGRLASSRRGRVSADTYWCHDQ
jgi:serine/threonine-protein kinase PknK